MEEEKVMYRTIDEYIAQCSPEVRPILTELREVIRACVPEGTEEKIAWRMPTFALHGNLVHFAAAKNHIGLYPGASGVASFQNRLSGYKTSKGAIQFPNGKPMPYDLIRDIVRFRVAENIKIAGKK